MQQPTQPPPDTPDVYVCCHCGELTREPVAVDWAFSSSGAGATIYACPTDAPRYTRDGAGERS